MPQPLRLEASSGWPPSVTVPGEEPKSWPLIVTVSPSLALEGLSPEMCGKMLIEPLGPAEAPTSLVTVSEPPSVPSGARKEKPESEPDHEPPAPPRFQEPWLPNPFPLTLMV